MWEEPKRFVPGKTPTIRQGLRNQINIVPFAGFEREVPEAEGKARYRLGPCLYPHIDAQIVTALKSAMEFDCVSLCEITEVRGQATR